MSKRQTRTSHNTFRKDSDQTSARLFDESDERLLERATRHVPAQMHEKEVRIEDYRPFLAAPSNWLSLVEARIRESVRPEEYEIEDSAEWLNAEAASAAIAFFQAGADALPSEPHIYATSLGDLVAEFETSGGTLTSVVSSAETILFAVMASDPHTPIERVVRRGSNSFIDELRFVTKKLATG